MRRRSPTVNWASDSRRFNSCGLPTARQLSLQKCLFPSDEEQIQDAVNVLHITEENLVLQEEKNSIARLLVSWDTFC